jgi:lipoprotein-anchoring transpeptidase ErfK/SrfK
VRPLVLILLVSAVAACGGRADSPESSDVAQPEKTVAVAGTTAKAPPSPCRAGEVRRVGSSTRTFAAVVQERATVYRRPGRAALASFRDENENGVPVVFGVLAERVDPTCEPQWYHVQLPLKPNGITGWVRAADVELAPITTRLVVDLSERRVTLLDRGREVLSARAAIGARSTPTPTGRYYVNQRLVPRDPTGPFGPGAIGISAFSEVLTGWTQGGPIAIHGTNRPDLIGQAVSNGCIRVRNDDLRRLFDRTLSGTPVTVRA